MKLPEDLKIGMSMSGGAAYGIAHIGVLKALKEYDLNPHVVYGTSAGAIAAVLYAAGIRIEEMKEFAANNQLRNVIRLTYPKLGFSSMDALEKRIGEYVSFENLEDLPLKTFVGVTNLETGLHETFSTGNIQRIVSASCAIPVFFQPIEIKGQLYVDGGVSNNMPVSELRESCSLVIGSDVVRAGKLNRKRINGFRRLLERTLTISLAHRTTPNYSQCDFVFQMTGLGKFGKFDFNKVDEFVDIGYRQTIKKLPGLLDIIQKTVMDRRSVDAREISDKT